jgi:hypothetical protein
MNRYDVPILRNIFPQPISLATCKDRLDDGWATGTCEMLLTTIVRAPLETPLRGTVPITLAVGKLLKLILTLKSRLKTMGFGLTKGDTNDVGKAFVLNVLAGLTADSSLRCLGMDHFPFVCLDTGT